MKAPWDALVDLSIVHFMIFPESMEGSGPTLETVSRIANDPFFSMIEMTHIEDHELRQRTAAVIRSAHMRIAFGAQPVILRKNLDLNSFDSTKRREAISAITTLVDEAKEVGAERLTLLSGPDPGEKNREAAKSFLIESLLELCAYAEQRTLHLCLETFDRDIEKKCLIGPSSEALIISTAVKREYPDFGLMYDMGHGPLLNEHPAQALHLLKDHLVHVHVGNCVKLHGHQAYGDKHPRFGLAGSEHDVTQLVEFLRVLFDIGYLPSRPKEVSPVIGFEVRPMPGESSDTVIANAKRTWRKAWNLI